MERSRTRTGRDVPGHQTRTERLAAALRENLKKRKAQARQRRQRDEMAEWHADAADEATARDPDTE